MSLPTIAAAVRGKSGLAIGNVLGSNISNILLILGAGAIMYPIVIEKRVRSIELPIMLTEHPTWQMAVRGVWDVERGLVEHSGIEPLTSCMPCRRSPS